MHINNKLKQIILQDMGFEPRLMLISDNYLATANTEYYH